MCTPYVTISLIVGLSPHSGVMGLLAALRGPGRRDSEHDEVS